MSKCRKIVLYNPTAVFWTMPLGLIAIGSALDPAQYEVEIVDARLEENPLSSLLTEARGALCVGMGVLTGEPIRDALGAARALKKEHPNIPVVWGGWHPSLFPAECLEENSVDVVVSGQGEVTFAELVERYSQGGDLHDIAGLTWKDTDGQIVQNQPRPTIDV
ncbi:MAG: cobalamin-dependent protein, partial [Chloroflexia bacterium]